jgi:hypothetical protein
MPRNAEGGQPQHRFEGKLRIAPPEQKSRCHNQQHAARQAMAESAAPKKSQGTERQAGCVDVRQIRGDGQNHGRAATESLGQAGARKA